MWNLGMEADQGIALHNFIKDRGVKSVIETGIAHGVSSYFIIHALGGKGTLVSIDPKVDMDTVIVGPKPYWKVIKDISQNVLEKELKNGVDLFMHDSDHCYDVMKWEYLTAYPKSKYIASHDVNHPGAGTVWADFLKETGAKELLNMGKFAIATGGLYNE